MHRLRYHSCHAQTSKKAKERTVKEEKPLGPTNVRPGELVFGVAHIYASFNDTFVVCGSVLCHAPRLTSAST